MAGRNTSLKWQAWRPTGHVSGLSAGATNARHVVRTGRCSGFSSLAGCLLVVRHGPRRRRADTSTACPAQACRRLWARIPPAPVFQNAYAPRFPAQADALHPSRSHPARPAQRPYCPGHAQYDATRVKVPNSPAQDSRHSADKRPNPRARHPGGSHRSGRRRARPQRHRRPRLARRG